MQFARSPSRCAAQRNHAIPYHQEIAFIHDHWPVTIVLAKMLNWLHKEEYFPHPSLATSFRSERAHEQKKGGDVKSPGGREAEKWCIGNVLHEQDIFFFSFVILGCE